MSTKKYLYRDVKNGKISGVAAGLADYFDLDVTLIRIIWILLVFCAGTGVLAYIIMAIVIEPKSIVMAKHPEEKETVIDNSDDPFAKYDKK
ncbi:MAG: PspC domain-containing protein [Firmicutes bacterium]|nr:PspC domain-containing protein [Bacillota bacterium]